MGAGYNGPTVAPASQSALAKPMQHGDGFGTEAQSSSEVINYSGGFGSGRQVLGYDHAVGGLGEGLS